MKKIISTLLLMMNLIISFCQEDIPYLKELHIQEMHVDKNFSKKYIIQLNKLRVTYPLALKANNFIIEYEKDLDKLNKKRKKRKYTKYAHKSLKDEFNYNIKDLYKSEGTLLLKLIHRETGMTVYQIIKKFRGKLNASLYNSIGKLWQHNLDITYDKYGEDWITEIVIQDILSGKINFNFKIQKIDRIEYKSKMKIHNENIRKSRKKNRMMRKLFRR